jgi:hypothetical protein
MGALPAKTPVISHRSLPSLDIIVIPAVNDIQHVTYGLSMASNNVKNPGVSHASGDLECSRSSLTQETLSQWRSCSPLIVFIASLSFICP